MVHHIKKIKDKNHWIISIDEEKALDKNTPLGLKNAKQMRNRRNYLNIIKNF